MLPVLLAALAAGAGPSFVEDDFAKALAQAKQQKKLLFVDAWAPWCHTCVYMREHVLTRPAFKAFEKDVVFASVDTEKEKNGAFLEKYPVDVWPTLFFVDAASGQVVFKWAGSADEQQMTALLEAAKGAQGATEPTADVLLARGEALQAVDKYLATKGQGGARGTVSLLYALYAVQKYDTCAQAALDGVGAAGQLPSDFVAVVSWGLSCALQLPEKDALRGKALAALVPEAKKGLTLPGAMADDVSSLYELLVEERQAAKDTAEALALARGWSDFLEREAALSPTPQARAVFDAHRLGAALAAKTPARVVDALKLSEAQVPGDWNPSARLATAYRELGRFDEALAAVERALGKCKEGPRRICLFKAKATLFDKKGDVAGRQATAKAGLEAAKKQRPSKALSRCVNGLDALAQ